MKHQIDCLNKPTAPIPASNAKNRRRGRHWLMPAGLFLGVLLVGCIPSLHPIYTEKDVIFDEALVGAWREDPESDDDWTFQKGEEDKTYHLILRDGENSSPFTVRLVKLGEQRFIDLKPHRDGLDGLKTEDFYRMGLVRGHLFLRVDQIEPELKMQMLSVTWLENLLKEEPQALAHYKEAKEIFVLTAPTQELQSFLIKHLGTEGAWDNLDVMKRKAP